MAEKIRSQVVSGIQPTGQLMIGNYIGAVKSWVELQAVNECFFFLADLHAITVLQGAVDLRRRSLEVVALLLACGVDPERSTIFLQSHVPAHAQLLWVLNCAVPMGELQRMTQFKEKAYRGRAGIPVGLFDYPVLMAADILLYGADLVPVGDDQKQHLEFTRTIARRFNGLYGKIFKIPEAFMPRTGARLMGLQDPLAKMSKSDANAENYVALLDPAEAVRRKIMAAVTDSGREVRCDEGKPGISNLVRLFAAVSGEEAVLIEDRFAGKGYAEFKKSLAELMIDFLSPIQRRYRLIAADPASLADLLQKGARKARERSEATLERVYRAVGFVPAERDHRTPAGGWMPGYEGVLYSPVPAAPGARHDRRKTMETKDNQDRAVVETAQSDMDEESMADCCGCCCCDTEEECGME
ncbi:MAG: tryptophan--tRNA ligase [Hyphomicrobiales bacterium]